MVVLEVGQEVQEVTAADRAARPLAVTAPPQGMESVSLVENIFDIVCRYVYCLYIYIQLMEMTASFNSNRLVLSLPMSVFKFCM